MDTYGNQKAIIDICIHLKDEKMTNRKCIIRKYHSITHTTRIAVILMLLIAASLNPSAQAQHNRLTTGNTIGWYNVFGTFTLDNRWSVHTEYQWRRTDVVENWQQSLLRVGVNYHLNPRVLFRVGYGWIETFPYGEIPINTYGKDFTEHRIFQMAQLSHREGLANLSHRFMLEQRFVGSYGSSDASKEDRYPMLNRLRYMFRVQVPLKGKEIKSKTPYVLVYDELFVGFGKNVQANIYDQNRLGVLLGYRFSDHVGLNAGYLYQNVQLGRQINQQNVFQNNHGIIVNLSVNADVYKKKS